MNDLDKQAQALLAISFPGGVPEDFSWARVAMMLLRDEAERRLGYGCEEFSYHHGLPSHDEFSEAFGGSRDKLNIFGCDNERDWEGDYSCTEVCIEPFLIRQAHHDALSETEDAWHH